jgi:hypothetical protein
VALQESANEGGTNGESFGNLSGGFTGFSSLENAKAKVMRDRCHEAVRGKSSDTPGC